MPSNPLELDRDLGSAVHHGLAVPQLQALIRQKGISLQAESEKLMLLAAYSSRDDVLEWLLREPGVTLSPYAVDDRGSSLLDIAVGNQDDGLVHWIMSHERIDSFRMLTLRNGNSLTVLETAIQSQNTKVIWGLVHDVERIPWHSQIFRKVWLRLLESTTGDMLDVLHLPWREYQLRDIWRLYESEHVEKDELEIKLQSCDWWPLFVDESVWNDRERSYLESAMRRAAAKGHVDIVRWLADDWGIDVNVVNMGASDDLQGFLTLPDCAVHGAVSWERHDLTSRQEVPRCCREVSQAVGDWDGKEAQGLATELQTAAAILEDKTTDPAAAAGTQEAAMEVQKELDSLTGHRSATRTAVLDFLLTTFASGAMPRLDLVILTGKVQVLEMLRCRGRLELDKLIVIHQEQTASGPAQAEECAVCFGELRTSVSFPCKHRFCSACHFDLRVARKPGQRPLCPLCRAPVPVWSEELEALLVKHLRVTCTWLLPLLEPGMAMGDVLGAVAARSGMLSVVQWLRASGARMTRRFGGQNFMHLAAAGGHYKLVKWLCCNGMRYMGSERCDEGRLPVHEAAMAGDRSSVLFLVGETLGGADAAGRPVSWYCRESPSKELQGDAQAWARVRLLSAELPPLLAAAAPLEALTPLLLEGGLGADTAQLEDGADRARLVGFLREVCQRGRADVLRWLYVSAGLQWVRGLETSCLRDPSSGPAPVFSLTEAMAASRAGAADDGRVMAVMAEVEAAKQAEGACRRVWETFQACFSQGAAVHALLALAQEQAAILRTVPPELRHWFAHLQVELSACGDGVLEARLCEAAALGHAHLCQWMLLEPRIDLGDAAVVGALVRATVGGRLPTVQLLLEEALRREVDVNKLPKTHAEPGATVSVFGLAIQGALWAEGQVARGRSLQVLKWLVGCPEVELAALEGKTALEELASCAQILRSTAGRGSLGRRPRRKKQAAEDALHSAAAAEEAAASHEDVLEVMVRGGLQCARWPRHAQAVKTLAECGNMVLVRRLAIEEGVNVQSVQPFWDMLMLWFDRASAAAVVEEWRQIRRQQEALFELADDVLRGAAAVSLQRVVGVDLRRLRDRHGRLVLAGAKADGSRPALEWLARHGVSDCARGGSGVVGADV